MNVRLQYWVKQVPSGHKIRKGVYLEDLLPNLGQSILLVNY